MKNKCTKFRNYRPYTAKSLGTWKMFDNPTDNHTDIEVPLYYELRFTKLKIAKNSYFEIWHATLHGTHLLKLLDKMYKYEMDPTRTVGPTEQTQDAGRTDGPTDGVKPIYPPNIFVVWGYNSLWGGIITHSLRHKYCSIHTLLKKKAKKNENIFFATLYWKIFCLPQSFEDTVGPVPCSVQSIPGTHPTNRILIKFEIQSKFGVLWLKIWSQRNFVHVKTVFLSWHVQNFVVISRIYYELKHYKVSLNFKFDRNIVSGTGACNHYWH